MSCDFCRCSNSNNNLIPRGIKLFPQTVALHCPEMNRFEIQCDQTFHFNGTPFGHFLQWNCFNYYASPLLLVNFVLVCTPIGIESANKLFRRSNNQLWLMFWNNLIVVWRLCIECSRVIVAPEGKVSSELFSWWQLPFINIFTHLSRTRRNGCHCSLPPPLMIRWSLVIPHWITEDDNYLFFTLRFCYSSSCCCGDSWQFRL